ncbi:hypothetical protein RLEG12_00655 (plasmid) [Rhizobium leguminosarum bv. trifolii CB782]|nr:hypothetical protein RLEG12_00655 [Rhizobium leguminosarum bv. trifolii CB782]
MGRVFERHSLVMDMSMRQEEKKRDQRNKTAEGAIMKLSSIGSKAGLPSEPYTMGPARTYKELLFSAGRAGLGTDLIVQACFGGSGRRTFFIASKEDYNRYASTLSVQPDVKIIKRFNRRSAAVEACVTPSCTLVGPLMTDVVGNPELTPYKGGWAGNGIPAGTCSEEIRTKAREMTRRFGDQLLKEGYRGCFKLEIVIDDHGEAYPGDLHQLISGASSLTDRAAFALTCAPMFLFHLLGLSGIGCDADMKGPDDRFSREEFVGSWPHLVIKSTMPLGEIVTHAPATGIYRMTLDGSVSYDRFANPWEAIGSDEQAFFLRLTDAGDFLYEGGCLGVLFVRWQVTNHESELNERARDWIRGIESFYGSRSVTEIQGDKTREPNR